jgi:Uma2 family endonuclease
MSEPALKRMTVEEYLQSEQAGIDKHEFVDGFMYPLHGQAGASKAHVRISTNIIAALHQESFKAGCRLYQSDMKLRISKTQFFYPDVMVACGSDNPDEDFETAPCLLIEVLSGSTAGHDRVGKYNTYTSIESLQTYLMVEQAERRVYEYTRQNNQWILTEHALSGEIYLPCLAATLTLDQIYQGL